jgi:phospholipid transport system substrate-binding protein
VEQAGKWVLLLALVLPAPASLAQGPAPDEILRAVSVKVIDRIGQDRDRRTANVGELIEANILPLFDFVHMTRLAMARNWHLATPEQQRALTEEFRTLLVRSYATALDHYGGQAIEFRPLRRASLDSDVTVRSVVKQPGKERMTVDYDMEETTAGWRIYDVTVAGVRLVATYRDVFAEKVRDGGVDGLIKSLADGNRGGGSRFKSVRNSVWENFRVMFAIFEDGIRGSRRD